MDQVLDIRYIYLYTHVMICNSCYCYLYYDIQWFCFWAWRLSIERVVGQPLHLYFFPLGVKVFGYFWMAATLYSFI